MENFETVTVETDLLILGGGMAACGAAVEAAYWAKQNGLKVTMVDKAAVDRLRHIRGMDERHHLTLLCRDLSELASYARVDNLQYRMLRLGTPGPFTFILKASREVPRRVSHPQRKTIGLRVPDHRTLQALLALLEAPLLGTTLILPGQTEPLSDPVLIRQALEHEVAGVIDAGPCGLEPTTVVDLSGDAPTVIRQGQGAIERIGMV